MKVNADRFPISDQELSEIRHDAMEFAGIGLYRYRFDGTIQFMNNGALKIFELDNTYKDPAMLAGKNIEDLLEYVGPKGRLRKAIKKYKRLHRFEYTFKTLSGNTKWVLHDSYLVKDQKTGEESVQVLMLDITDSILAKNAVEQSEKKFRALVEQSLQGFIILQDFQIKYANPSIVETIGYSKEELIALSPKQVLGIVHDEDRQDVGKRIHSRMEGGILPPRYEFRTYHKDGSVRWLESFTQPLQYMDKPALQITFLDITKHKLAEKEKSNLATQLRQAQKMEALGTLAGGIAHDFNNLLAGIIGNINMANLDAPSQLKRFLDSAETTAKRAADLIKQLLTFSRKSDPVFKSVSPGKIVDETAKILRETIDRRIMVDSLHGEDIWPILADPAQVHQIVLNLGINARDAILDMLGGSNQNTPGHSIRLELQNVTIDDAYCAIHHEALPGQYVSLSVIDNGAGMDTQTLSRIYEPFFTTKEQGKGTGLGLATAFGIIKQHKGWITVSSTPGEGTTFQVFFPKYTGELHICRKLKHIEEIPGGDETILFVDDEEVLRDVGKAILERKGYRVLLAEDGKHAMEMFAKHMSEIKLIILDLTMPHLSGDEVLRQIRMIKPEMKAIITSGYSVNRNSEMFDELGPFLIISKPYDPQFLSRKVRDLLDEIVEFHAIPLEATEHPY